MCVMNLENSPIYWKALMRFTGRLVRNGNAWQRGKTVYTAEMRRDEKNI